MFLPSLHIKCLGFKILFCWFVLSTSVHSFAQYSANDTVKLYRVNKLTSSLIVGAGFATNAIGLKILDNRSKVTESDLANITKNDVPKFERWILNQNSHRFEYWHNQSDMVMKASLILPAAFLMHKSIRNQWVDYSLMYLKAQAFSANLYTLGVPQFYRKYRPLLYYDNLPINERTGVRLSNSFYSGHVSVTATSMFFMASVYHDLYPDRNLIIPLSVASLTTVYVAMGRIRGGKHFLTDVLSGAVFGGLIGYLTPHFHSKNRTKKENAFSLNIGYLNFEAQLKF